VSESLLNLIPLALTAATPLLLAVMGELIVQRSGMINLGLEGMLLASAFGAVLAASSTSSVAAGFAGGVAGAFLIALVFGVMTIQMRCDQIVTGTAINLLALGITGVLYRELNAQNTLVSGVPRLLPSSGNGSSPLSALLRVDPITLISWSVVPIAAYVLLFRTRFGLKLRACGEEPEALRATGHSVSKYRWTALAIQAALAGIGGAYLSLALSSGFAENMVAGRGFIALAVVIFARWQPAGAVAGAALFGVTAALQFFLQSIGSGFPFHLLLALPYIVTLVILGTYSNVRAPRALGK